MKEHKIGYYYNGYKKVSYCYVCGVEGLELNKECPGEEAVKLPEWWLKGLGLDKEPKKD